MLLDIITISVCYAESTVCQGVTLNVDQGEAVCLLGRNGVGKTTLLKSIMGLVEVRNGMIVFDGKNITNEPPFKVANCGIGYVPQGRMIFPQLSVEENLRLGAIARQSRSRGIPEIVFEYFPILKERKKQPGGTLSGGQQQMLAVGRALAGRPRLLLLDEPTEGLSAGTIEELTAMLKRLVQETGVSLLLVEQNLDMAMETSTRGYVMEKGCIVASGNLEKLQSDDIVKSHLVI